MLLNSDIIPGASLGGVLIGETIDSVFERFSEKYEIEIFDEIAVFEGGLISIGYTPSGIVHSVMCGDRFPGNYKGILWVGMTVSDVIAKTKKQIAFGGCVVVDGIEGIGLPLPPSFDDFEKITDFLSLDHMFGNLSVFRA
ncbi:hypothetical protein [Acidovorax sp. NCPPB 3576]|uniref:hypothetical protein n=1 Tax=Acidovorax sp. NCPPB 3576 TaxID=2940488 RepID=UPI00234BBF8C|nr:hypothetical protein [Acidovorax sp. NCPPB 3576]WCM88932.1 hypothetical protein M5C98_02435 [Acidovorax sp. NCPPB 3576]